MGVVRVNVTPLWKMDNEDDEAEDLGEDSEKSEEEPSGPASRGCAQSNTGMLMQTGPGEDCGQTGHPVGRSGQPRANRKKIVGPQRKKAERSILGRALLAQLTTSSSRPETRAEDASGQEKTLGGPSISSAEANAEAARPEDNATGEWRTTGRVQHMEAIGGSEVFPQTARVALPLDNVGAPPVPIPPKSPKLQQASGEGRQGSPAPRVHSPERADPARITAVIPAIANLQGDDAGNVQPFVAFTGDAGQSVRDSECETQEYIPPMWRRPEETPMDQDGQMPNYSAWEK